MNQVGFWEQLIQEVKNAIASCTQQIQSMEQWRQSLINQLNAVTAYFQKVVKQVDSLKNTLSNLWSMYLQNCGSLESIAPQPSPGEGPTSVTATP